MIKSTFKIGDYLSEIKSFIFVFISFFLVFRSFPANRVGDGSEYILQYSSVINSYTPWINQVDLIAYDKIIQSQKINLLVDSNFLYNAFPSLRLEDNFDLNHFWFYAALAGICHIVLRFFLIETSAVSAFLILHGLMFAFLAQTVFRKHKIPGLLAVLSLLFTSPLLWYANKIHTEFFTFILVTLAAFYIFNSSFGPAAIALGFASTQNISFGLLALIALIFHLKSQKGEKFSRKNVLVTFLTTGIVLVHPLYFLIRHGVVTPTLKAGGVNVNSNFSDMFVWIVDPDIGLLPNWPFGILLLIFVITNLKRKKVKNPLRSGYFHFLLVFLVVSLYAQSSTTNINSGATPGPSRYGLWYVGLFLPAALGFFILVKDRWLTRTGKAMSLTFSVSLVVALFSYLPIRSESYTTPSHLSRTIQTYFPNLYNPAPELFMERYSGKGEEQYSIVIGPDCKKMLIRPSGEVLKISAPKSCQYSVSQIEKYVVEKNLIRDKDYYFFTPEGETSRLAINITGDELNFSETGNGQELLIDGWSTPEAWGVWGQGKSSTLIIPCAANSSEIKSARITAGSFGMQKFEIAQVNSELRGKEFFFEGNFQEISVPLDTKSCIDGFYTLKVKSPGAVSPVSKGLSEDPRELGLSLIKIKLEQ